LKRAFVEVGLIMSHPRSIPRTLSASGAFRLREPETCGATRGRDGAASRTLMICLARRESKWGVGYGALVSG